MNTETIKLYNKARKEVLAENLSDEQIHEEIDPVFDLSASILEVIIKYVEEFKLNNNKNWVPITTMAMAKATCEFLCGLDHAGHQESGTAFKHYTNVVLPVCQKIVDETIDEILED